MYTVPVKVAVQTKTLISAFENGQLNSLNVEGSGDVDQPKPLHPELYTEELATPGTAKKLLLAFESKRQESQSVSTGGVTTGRLSLERFSSFENKTATVSVEKQSNGVLHVNGDAGSGEAVLTVEKTDVKADNAAGSLQVEQKVVELSKEVNGAEQTVTITTTTMSTSVHETTGEEIREKISQEIENRVEERVEAKVKEAIEEKVEERLEEKVSKEKPAATQDFHVGSSEVEVKIEVKAEVKKESEEDREKAVEAIEERVEEKKKEKIEDKVEEKVKEKVEERVKEAVEEKVEKHLKETIQENVVEMIEEAVANEIKEETEVSTKSVTVTVTKTPEESVKVTKEVKVVETAECKKPHKTTLIVTSVKPDGGIDATLRYATMKTLEELGHRVLYTDTQRPADFDSERKKLLEADFVIINYRPIMNSPPASLKSWLEGTLIQADGSFINKDLLSGKKAIVLITTEAQNVPEEKLLSLPFLSSVQEDILRAIAMEVISPFVIFGAGQNLDELAQKHHVDAWTKRLATIFI